jgi:2-polyprenyl-3-methyl-5-hydroxy-6-metoxy-1,4-benzoquinol methylase
MPDMSTPVPLSAVLIEHDEGTVRVEELGDGRRCLSVELTDPSQFISRRSAQTSYPVSLIKRLLEVIGPQALCDEILREEDNNYVALDLRYALFTYLGPEEFAEKRLLDFGCGSGSSTLVLARMLPRTEIVGIELEPSLLEVATLRAGHRGCSVQFEVSPTAESLPSGIGSFDFVILSAVYEHLLPRERPLLLAQLWACLRPGGVLFINATPNRYYPLEFHTTGLPLLNYVPDRLAARLTRRFSRQWARSDSWEQMLRRGIRGATRGEILRLLAPAGPKPQLLTPTLLGCNDEIDVWYAVSVIRNPRGFKPAMRTVFKAFARLTGHVPVPQLNIAIRKPGAR